MTNIHFLSHRAHFLLTKEKLQILIVLIRQSKFYIQPLTKQRILIVIITLDSLQHFMECNFSSTNILVYRFY
jgi:hypothetical protein